MIVENFVVKASVVKKKWSVKQQLIYRAKAVSFLIIAVSKLIFLSTTNVKQSNAERFLLFRIRVFKDEAAFAKLLGSYSAALQRFLYFKLPTQDDIEDAYSILSMRLWEYMVSTQVEHFSGLAHTIARGVVAEFYRTRKDKEDVQLKVNDPVEEESASSPTDTIETNIDVSLAKEAMKNLPDEDREAIILRHLEGYSIKEIALHLGKTENATSVLIHRALKKLGDMLEKK